MSDKYKNICSIDKHLRDYQTKAKADIFASWDEVNNVMLQMPTGTGKTVLFSSIINDVTKYNPNVQDKILVIVHRTELIAQAREKLHKMYYVRTGVIAGGHPRELLHKVQVASIQTLTHPANTGLAQKLSVEFIIIDEAHHSVANSYRKLWEWYPNAKKLGVTATPWRMNHSGFRSVFQKIILTYPVKQFISEGHLSTYKYYSIKPESKIQKAINAINEYDIEGDYKISALERDIDKEGIRAQLYDSYAKYVYGKKGIIYAISRKHSENICWDYRKHGIRIRHIDSTTPKDERKKVVKDFKDGLIDIIVNVDIFSEGFDCPDIEFIQLARPTQSLVKYLQQVGRGLRPHPGKDNCVILDNVGVHSRFGLPDSDRHWFAHFNGQFAAEAPRPITSGNYGGGRSKNTDEGNEDMVLIQDEGMREIKTPQKERANRGKSSTIPKERKSDGPVPFKRLKDYYKNTDKGCCIVDSKGHPCLAEKGRIEEFLGKLYRIEIKEDNSVLIAEIVYNDLCTLFLHPWMYKYKQNVLLSVSDTTALSKAMLSSDCQGVENIEVKDNGNVEMTLLIGDMLKFYNQDGSEIVDLNDGEGEYIEDMELVNQTSVNVNSKLEDVEDEIPDVDPNDLDKFCDDYGYTVRKWLLCLGDPNELYEIYLDDANRYVIDKLHIDKKLMACYRILYKSDREDNEFSILGNEDNYDYYKDYWENNLYVQAVIKHDSKLYEIIDFGKVKEISHIHRYENAVTVIKVLHTDVEGNEQELYFDFEGNLYKEEDAIFNKYGIIDKTIESNAQLDTIPDKMYLTYRYHGKKVPVYSIGFASNLIASFMMTSDLGILVHKHPKEIQTMRVSDNEISIYNGITNKFELYNDHGVFIKSDDDACPNEKEIEEKTHNLIKEYLIRSKFMPVDDGMKKHFDNIEISRNKILDSVILAEIQKEFESDTLIYPSDYLELQKKVFDYGFFPYGKLNVYLIRPKQSQPTASNSAVICQDSDLGKAFNNKDVKSVKSIDNKCIVINNRKGDEIKYNIHGISTSGIPEDEIRTRSLDMVKDFLQKSLSDSKKVRDQVLFLNSLRDKSLDEEVKEGLLLPMGTPSSSSDYKTTEENGTKDIYTDLEVILHKKSVKFVCRGGFNDHYPHTTSIYKFIHKWRHCKIDVDIYVDKAGAVCAYRLSSHPESVCFSMRGKMRGAIGDDLTLISHHESIVPSILFDADKNANKIRKIDNQNLESLEFGSNKQKLIAIDDYNYRFVNKDSNSKKEYPFIVEDFIRRSVKTFAWFSNKIFIIKASGQYIIVSQKIYPKAIKPIYIDLPRKVLVFKDNEANLCFITPLGCDIYKKFKVDGDRLKLYRDSRIYDIYNKEGKFVKQGSD